MRRKLALPAMKEGEQSVYFAVVWTACHACENVGSHAGNEGWNKSYEQIKRGLGHALRFLRQMGLNSGVHRFFFPDSYR